MRILLFLLPLITIASESFISDYEYGEMLYKNPRGVSCDQCHGLNAEGKVIVQYSDKKGKHVLKGTNIQNTTLIDMIKAVTSDHKVMPRYYLTDEEIKAIYEYLKVKNKQ